MQSTSDLFVVVVVVVVETPFYLQSKEFFGGNPILFAVRKSEITAVGIRHADHATTFYPQKLH
jgi:hypothetical protein